MTTGGASAALAQLDPRTRDPARALRIAGPPPGADPFPGPGGRKDAEVSKTKRRKQAVPKLADKLLLSDPKRLILAPGTAPTCPRARARALREVRLSPPPYPRPGGS